MTDRHVITERSAYAYLRDVMQDYGTDDVVALSEPCGKASWILTLFVPTHGQVKLAPSIVLTVFHDCTVNVAVRSSPERINMSLNFELTHGDDRDICVDHARIQRLVAVVVVWFGFEAVADHALNEQRRLAAKEG